jgi:hypothetical protein
MFGTDVNHTRKPNLTGNDLSKYALDAMAGVGLSTSASSPGVGWSCLRLARERWCWWNRIYSRYVPANILI